jgi:hypothetical protein
MIQTGERLGAIGDDQTSLRELTVTPWERLKASYATASRTHLPHPPLSDSGKPLIEFRRSAPRHQVMKGAVVITHLQTADDCYVHSGVCH